MESFIIALIKNKEMRLFSILILMLFARLHAMSDVDQLLSEASARNAYFLYEDAVKLLNEAIKLDPYEKETYKERAFSYFELNRIDLALEDYQRAIDSKPPPHVQNSIRTYSLLSYSPLLRNPPRSLEFAKGLLYGAMLGGKEGSIECVSSIRGGLTFLWSFACSPTDVSKELIEALRDIGEFLASGKVYSLLQEAVPEFFECAEYWDIWSEYVKGQKLGFIIGKYSILVFYYIATPNVGIHFYNKLRRSNIMAILGRYSVTRSAHILEASAKHAKRSTSILKRAAAGCIVPHNPNVLPHVFTKKHRWDKFIKMTGNYEIDFKKLAIFLEEEGILQCPRKLNFERGGIFVYKYTKDMGRDKIVALFEINEKGLPLLKNAWVEAKSPYIR